MRLVDRLAQDPLGDTAGAQSDARTDAVDDELGRPARVRTVLAWLAHVVPMIAIPFVAFAWRIGLWTLNPLAAPRMAVWDYATYISGPNFLRTAPIFSIPFGSTPDHMAPVGSNLGITDSTPLLTPLYRLLNAIEPDRPTQLIGPILLVAYIGTFLAAYRLVVVLARRLDASDSGWQLHLAGLFGATALLMNPMFLLRFVHPTLTHHWVLLWPLATALDARAKHPDRRQMLVVLLQIAAASAIQPYFVPMVAVIHAPFVVRALRADVRVGAALTGGYLALVGVVSYLFGYVGSGAATTNEGFGNFSANLAFFFDPAYQSQLLRDIPSLPDSWEGRGYLGAGVLLAAVAGFAVLGATDARRLRALFSAARWALLGGVLLAVYAALPVIYVADKRIVDLSGVLSPFEGILTTFRSNGRFVWLAAWTLGAVVVVAVVLIPSRVVRFMLLGLCVVLQVHDLTPFPVASRSAADYEVAADVLEAMKERGVERVEVMPPSIVHACTSEEIPLDQVGPVILAAAVQRLPINSGYPGRPVAGYEEEICAGQVAAFSGGARDPGTAYILNAARPEVASMTCTPIAPSLVACRS